MDPEYETLTNEESPPVITARLTAERVVPSSDVRTNQTKTAPRRGRIEGEGRPRVVPGLVLAWAHDHVEAGDRAPVERRLVVGRGSSASWRIRDDLMSREHFEVSERSGQLVLRDLGSRNGTFLEGVQVLDALAVESGAVIRSGSCVFVVAEDLSVLAQPGDEAFPGFAGRFYSPVIVRNLRIAGHTGRSVLLEGESGSGKEIAANILHHLYRESGRPGPIVAHNGACFASEEDAVATLLGVAKGGFTGVAQRRGAIESADGGTLFLDEVHNLPLRVQRSLLRFVEDGVLQRLGGASQTHLDVRFIFGTNHPVSGELNDALFAHDLVARLHRVSLPPLRERRADIADIFLEVLHKTGDLHRARLVEDAFDEEVMERLIRSDYCQGNVRELEDMAAVLVARVAAGDEPTQALANTLGAEEEPLSQPHPSVPSDVPYGSPYEVHRQDIINGYYKVSGNLTHLEQLLRRSGISCSRRWLAFYLERWGIRKVKRRY